MSPFNPSSPKLKTTKLSPYSIYKITFKISLFLNKNLIKKKTQCKQGITKQPSKNENRISQTQTQTLNDNSKTHNKNKTQVQNHPQNKNPVLSDRVIHNSDKNPIKQRKRKTYIDVELPHEAREIVVLKVQRKQFDRELGHVPDDKAVA